MNRLILNRCALNGFVAAILLAGCGGFGTRGATTIPQGMVGPLQSNTIASSGSGAKAVRPNAYTWSEAIFSTPPPYPIRTKVQYFTGTVPVVLEPVNRYESFYGSLSALLTHTDKNGYALYSYYIGLWNPLSEYFGSIQIDGATTADWAITDQGYMWSDYYGGSTRKWRKYFSSRTFSSLAAHAPVEYHPTGFLFATERSGTNKGCSPSVEPCGHPILQFNPSGKWPNGTWQNTGWGGYQVAADPHTGNNEIVALDDKHAVWEIIPVIRSGSFEGYMPIPLGTIKCSGSAITFEEVAAYDDVFLGLDDRKTGHAVWYYNSKGACWYEVGSKTGFTSIATDPNGVSGGYSLVWAVDSHGNVWYAH